MSNQSLTINSEIGNIVCVQNFIEQLKDKFKVSDKLFGRISLATTEAVNNSIIHGNQNNRTKQVRIEVTIENGVIQVTVEDEGEGFDYNLIPDPTAPENILKSSGRGLYLMKTLSDSLEFENNGSKVIMSFGYMPG